MRRTKWSAAALALSVFALAACGDQAGDGQVREQPAASQPQQQASQGGDLVAQGQQLFNGQGICFTCHGMNGTGGQLAPDLTDGEWLWIDPAAGDMETQIATLIETGVAQPKQFPSPMPPMAGVQLSKDQIRALAAYVASLSKAS